MKHACLCLFGLLLPGAGPAAAQTPAPRAGLYASAADFQARRLRLACDCQPVRLRVRLHDWPARSYLTVVRGARKDTVAKAAVYGYRDCAGRDFRLVRGQWWPVLNPTEDVLLYRLEQPTVGKTPGYVRLYFSQSAAAGVYPLTPGNLKRAFPANDRLHQLLDAQGPHSHGLADQDAATGRTVLAQLLQLSRLDTTARGPAGDPARPRPAR